MSQWVELVYSRGGRERGREEEGVMGFMDMHCHMCCCHFLTRWFIRGLDHVPVINSYVCHLLSWRGGWPGRTSA